MTKMLSRRFSDFATNGCPMFEDISDDNTEKSYKELERVLAYSLSTTRIFC